MAHKHLALYLGNRFKRDAHQDEHRSAAEADADTRDTANYNRHDSNDAQEECAQQGNTGNDFAEIGNGVLAGTDTRDSTVVFVKIISYFHWIILNRHVEVRESNNQQEIDQSIEERIGVEYAPELIPEGIVGLTLVRKPFDRGGNRDDRGGKDYRHNARHIHLHGNIGLLTAYHLSALHALCVLHGNPALGVLHEHYEPHDSEESYAHRRNYKVILRASSLCQRPPVDEGGEHSGTARNDTGKEKYRDTVAYALFVYLLAQPHNQSRTRTEAGDYKHRNIQILEIRVISSDYIVALEHDIIHCSLEYAKTYCGDAGNIVKLLAALAALLGKSLQRWDCHGEKLNDDLSRDVGTDTHCKYRGVLERASRQNVQIAEQIARIAAREATHHRLEGLRVDKGYGNRRAHTENEYNQYCVEELFAQVRDSKSISESLNHFYITSAFPPAASIFSAADLEKAAALTVRLFVS